MAALPLPSDTELSQCPIDELRERLSHLVPPVDASLNERFTFNVEKAFRQACYTGDLDRVEVFIRGLPPAFSALRQSLLNNRHAVSWAAYGRQERVIRYLCALQEDDALIGFDYRAVLEFIDYLKGVSFSQSDLPPLPRSLSQPDNASTMAVLARVAVERNAVDLLRAIEARVEKALDRQIENQMSRPV